MADGIWQLSKDDAENYWLGIAPFLVSPCQQSRGRHTPDSLFLMIQDGVFSLFVAVISRAIRSAAVVAVTDYSASRWLTIISCGGDKMVDWLTDGRQALEAFACHHDCLGIEIFGRKGWCRAMDLVPVGLWMERKL